MNHSHGRMPDPQPNDGRVTRVAVLGTLAEFGDEPIPYDVQGLVQLVSEIQPDLLCLDMTEQQWDEQDFSDHPEYCQALLPLAHGTDIVVVPIAEDTPPAEPSATGIRGKIIKLLRSWLGWIEHRASSPDAVNYGWRHDLSNFLYSTTLRLGGNECQEAWDRHTRHLIEATISTVRRDPDSRILVVVNVRHCHHIRPALAAEPGVEVVNHIEL